MYSAGALEFYAYLLGDIRNGDRTAILFKAIEQRQTV